ncbi:hypothetical protein FA10DRAFT_120919 [Acaromyces ingoldii]|uniref:Uncharacterized protein n=1 Tax=Acaromyces ingoldii TaxID=215250 RepID=A0A316YPT3_9BASI|nr:hypothetical protein FA10DRAFT_120919 [Acaromyces ingoldii]PWN90668.1 hypothetical protein FA10DRAFT_120919 [Acaromyces ingoldii]
MSDDGGQERISSVDLKQQARIEKSVREAQAKVASFHKSQEERKQKQLRGEITIDAAEAKKENAKIKRAETTLRKAEEKMNDFIRSSQEAGKGDSTFSSDNPFQKQQVPPSALPPSSPQRLGQLSQMTPPERQQESLMQRDEQRFGSEDELDTSPMLEAATNGRTADDEDVAPLDQETDERSAARRRENNPLFFQTQSTQGVESQTQSETQPAQSPTKTLASASEEVGYQKSQITAEASSATDSETSSDSNDDPGSEESSEDSDEGEEQDSAPPPAQHPPKSPRQEPTTPKVNGVDKESSVEPVEESSADEKDDDEEEEDEIESTPPANRTSIFGFIRNALANNGTTSTPTRGSSGDASAEVASRMQPRRKTGSRLSDLNPNVIRASISSAQNSPISQSAPQLTTSGNSNRRDTAASEGSSTDDDSSSDEDDSDSSSSSEDTGKMKTGVSSSQPLPASKRAGATKKPLAKKARKSGLAKLM